MVIEVQTSGMHSRSDSLIIIKCVVFMIKHVIITCDPLKSKACNNIEEKEQIIKTWLVPEWGKSSKVNFSLNLTISPKRF